MQPYVKVIVVPSWLLKFSNQFGVFTEKLIEVLQK
jgi:hypothetical protein